MSDAHVTLDLENARKDAEMKHKMRQQDHEGDLDVPFLPCGLLGEPETG
jgi:hypothetical protein